MYWGRMLSTAFIELDWKNVVDIKTDCDNLMLWSFSNSTGSIAEYFTQGLLLGIGIEFVLIWSLTLRILLRFM